jgi:hypothetical protein
VVQPGLSSVAGSGEGAAPPHASAWGFDEESGAPPSPAKFAVQLDQRFLTELAHTAVLFGELFDAASRPHLLRVCAARPPLAAMAACEHAACSCGAVHSDDSQALEATRGLIMP